MKISAFADPIEQIARRTGAERGGSAGSYLPGSPRGILSFKMARKLVNLLPPIGRKCNRPKSSPATMVRLSCDATHVVTCPSTVKVRISFPSLRSQTRSVWSPEPKTTWRPSGVTAKAVTFSVWPWSVYTTSGECRAPQSADNSKQFALGATRVFSFHFKIGSVTPASSFINPLTSSAFSWQNLYQTIFCFTGQTHPTGLKNFANLKPLCI